MIGYADPQTGINSDWAGERVEWTDERLVFQRA